MQHKENQTRFFIDAMLGNIAKKLRLFGYDSKYFSDIDDDELIKIAKEENRIIVSRDENLAYKAQKLGINTIFITKNKELEQFSEILKHIELDIFQISGDTARCPKCNSITESIDKSSIKNKVPKRVYDANERFWNCKNCGKYYWEGTHIKNLKEFVGKINERLQ